MSYLNCLRTLAQKAGRALTDEEVTAIYERIHKAALDIKAGRVQPGATVGMGKNGKDARGMLAKELGGSGDTAIEAAARRAAEELVYEAENAERQANLQLVRLGARMADMDRLRTTGMNPLEAVPLTIARDYSGRLNIESLEQKATGYRDYFKAQLLATWDALGNDFLGFFQDKAKLLLLIRELRGENTGDAMAHRGAEAFHATAEEARLLFNDNGGNVGKLDDWGMPQHHSQARVAEAAGSKDPIANRDAWIDAITPLLDRAKYVDDLGTPWTDPQLREFLEHAWTTIATDGNANIVPGKSMGTGKRANRHAEHRQIHFKDADSVIAYWDQFGEKTALEILEGHVETMARDIAFIEWGGPNPHVTYQTMRDTALRDATVADPAATPNLEGQAVAMDQLWDYASGRVKPTYNRTVRGVSDAISHLNTAGKLGGAALASFFGDKPMMEAVAHMNNMPMLQRWHTELALLNPANTADRRLLQTQGLMLDSVRSGLQRFYEGLGQSSLTGRIATAVMRVSGMQAINDIRKGAFGLSAMAAIGDEIARGTGFANLQASDARLLRTWGIDDSDWRTWQLASRTKIAGADNVLTPESISRISDNDLRVAGIISQAGGPEEAVNARRAAIVKLLGVVNTESEFAIVTPGWRERTAFYGDQQRGTVKGEITRSVLQFKSFPWAMLQRGMDAVANQDGPVSKAIMVSYLVTSTTLAGAMLMQTREMLAGKDPRSMVGDRDWWKFWAAAFIQGGALGIYGDFLYGANQTRMGSGILEALAGPTVGPLLELGLVQPMAAARGRMEGKDTHLAAKTLQDIKGFVPGGNLWYTKAALDHMIWQRVMEGLSPGYLSTIRQRTMKEYGQSWWWNPGEGVPDRAPDLSKALSQ